MLALAWLSVLLYLPCVVTQKGSDILNFVDPLIGTAKGGHVFAGATLPFGMAKAVADSLVDGQGGFATDGGKISGYVNGSEAVLHFPDSFDAGSAICTTLALEV